MALRVLHKQGTIDIKHIYWEKEDTYLYVNKEGGLEHWPKGFLGELDEYLDILCGLSENSKF